MASLLFLPAHVSSPVDNLGQEHVVIAPHTVALWRFAIELSHVKVGHIDLQGKYILLRVIKIGWLSDGGG